MGPTPIEDGKGRGYIAEVDSNRDLHTRTLLASGANEAAVTDDGELLARSTIIGDGNEALVDGDGRLLTSALVPSVSKVVHTNYLAAAVDTVDTLSSRADRSSMFFMNTGSTVVHFTLAGEDPTSDDLRLAAGERFVVPFTTDTATQKIRGCWTCRGN